MAWPHSNSGPKQNAHTTSHLTWSKCMFKSSYTSIATRYCIATRSSCIINIHGCRLGWRSRRQNIHDWCHCVEYYHGYPISWISQKQKTVSPSTSVAAYKTMSYAFTEGMSYYALIEKEIKQSITPIPTTMNSLNPVAPSK